MHDNSDAVGQVGRVLALRTFPAFRDLSPAELSAIAEHARPKFFRKNQQVYRPGIPVRALHFVLRGRLAVSERGGAREVVGPRQVLGGLEALSQESAGQSVVAVEDTLTLQLDSENLEEVFEDNFPILVAILRALAAGQIALRRRLGPRAGFPEPQASPPNVSSALDLVERIICLRQTMDFAGTRIEALADLAQETRRVELAAGARLWEAGDSADYALVLIQGRIDAVTGDGTQRFTLGPPATVGGIDSLARGPRWYTATASSPVLGLRIDTQVLLDVIEDNTDIATDMLRVFARDLRSLQRQLSHA